MVQHRSEIQFPFKRYQIQPVWRADRPQRGRYREFYQCDVDVIGSDSMLNEFELVQIMDAVFNSLGLEVKIRLNNRRVLAGIVDMIGESDRMIDITMAIDKLEKVGMEKVMEELKMRGVGDNAMRRLEPIFSMKGTSAEKLDSLEELLAPSASGAEGLKEVRQLLGYLDKEPVGTTVEFDMTLARGLDYYTGTIFEVTSTEVQIGSICGGGRYDDLTGIFGLDGISGVGVSFGADRIYDVLEQLDRFPDRGEKDTVVLFVNFGEREVQHIFPILARLRRNGIPSELYPDSARMKKQMGYANARKIPFVALVGEEEINKGVVTLKEMDGGNQERLTPGQLVERLCAGSPA